MAGTFDNPEIVQEEVDVLLIGGGMACCGAGYEIMRWAEAVKAETGKDLKIKLVDKAAMDRSGADQQDVQFFLDDFRIVKSSSHFRVLDS